MTQPGFKQPDFHSEFFDDLVTFPLGGGVAWSTDTRVLSCVPFTHTPATVTPRWILAPGKGLCTSAQLKTANEVQVELFNCQHSQALLCGGRGRQATMRTSVIEGELVPGCQQPPAHYRGGRSPWVGVWAGADLPVGGEKRWEGKAGLWRRQASGVETEE